MRIIAHLDMDAFFAAVEERDNPRFKGLPIVVGSDPLGGKGRGVVSTANYKARVYGIRSALPISKAWEYAEQARKEGKPKTVFLGVDMERYAESSSRVRAIVARHTDTIEQASIDEFYLEVSSAGSFTEAARLCGLIKREIMEEERLTCSVGIGPNKLIAKIASDFKKPDGMTVVETERAASFLAPLPVRKMPGIGPKTEEVLRAEGVRTIGDIVSREKGFFSGKLGKWGADLYEKAFGRDDSPVTEEYETKSIGEQETFMRDTRDAGALTGKISALCATVHARFSESGFSSFRTVAVTVRFGDFETKSRAHTLTAPAEDAHTLAFEAMKLFLPFLDSRENPERKTIRLVGVRIEKLQ